MTIHACCINIQPQSVKGAGALQPVLKLRREAPTFCIFLAKTGIQHAAISNKVPQMGWYTLIHRSSGNDNIV